MAKETITMYQLAKTPAEETTVPTMTMTVMATTTPLTLTLLMTTLLTISGISMIFPNRIQLVNNIQLSMDGDIGEGGSMGDGVSMGSDFSDSLTELRAGGRNFFGEMTSGFTIFYANICYSAY